MTTGKLDLVALREAAEKTLVRECWQGTMNARSLFYKAADPTTVLALIARAEASEAKLIRTREDLIAEQELRRDRDEDVAHEFGLRDKAEHDLATAAKLIEEQHEALRVCETALDGLAARDSYGVVHLVGGPVLVEAQQTLWEDAEEAYVPALAAHDDYRKGRDDGS